jgi:REP element-mobilizing transposase RayT
MRHPIQQSFDLPTWGGARRGAGRKRRVGDLGEPRRAQVPHRARQDVSRHHPVHVTLRMLERVWNLRSLRSFAIFDAAVRGVATRPDFRVVHFSVQRNHVHLVVEAAGSRALANGVRALSIRLARGMNALMGTRGPLLDGRYHAHVLRTPAEVRNALRYVIGNHASHAARRGEPLPGTFADPYASASPRSVGAQLGLWASPATAAARTWLLRRAA